LVFEDSGNKKIKAFMNIFSKYYHRDLENFFSQITPNGYLIKIINSQNEIIVGQYDYIILTNTLSYVEDIQIYVQTLKEHCKENAKIVVINFNFLWKPFLDFATKIGLREKTKNEPNWLWFSDLQNIFSLEGYQEVKTGRRFLFPVPLGNVSDFINKYLAHLPLLNSLCLTTYQIYRSSPRHINKSVSIIIPARNEEGNIKNVLKKIPSFGGSQVEVIFIEGHSKDNTLKAIKSEIKSNRTDIRARVYKQGGVGKGDAVRLGFQKAKNDILMILDADLTVNPDDLPKFYNALVGGHCDLANGSRLVYPMEQEAMRTLNYIGNKIFSVLFTFLLGQKIKDTLCGTKALLRKDYIKIAKNRKYFGNFDPFGDFDLLFGACRLNLKIVDIPVRYRERRYGATNISRFSHGLLLLKMTFFAAKKIKFI